MPTTTRNIEISRREITLSVMERSGINLYGAGAIGRYDPAGEKYFYFTDHLGSTRAVVDELGNVVQAQDYYPFIPLRSISRPSALRGLIMPDRSFLSGAPAREGFTGKELDQESGLIYAGARYYIPNIGRWTGVDPLAGKYPGWSPYNYVLNNPLRFADPDGREVRAADSTTAQRIVDDILELYPDAPVGFEQRTKRGKTHYVITIDGASDFDWDPEGDPYLSALYDVIVSEDVVFNVFYQETGPHGLQKNVDFQTAGGGHYSRPGLIRDLLGIREAKVYVDPRGYQRTVDPSSIILMHELVGHGHPVATPTAENPENAHDINRFYRSKLGLNPNVSYRRSHPGYQVRNMRWPRTGLYRN